MTTLQDIGLSLAAGWMVILAAFVVGLSVLGYLDGMRGKKEPVRYVILWFVTAATLLFSLCYTSYSLLMMAFNS